MIAAILLAVGWIGGLLAFAAILAIYNAKWQIKRNNRSVCVWGITINGEKSKGIFEDCESAIEAKNAFLALMPSATCEIRQYRLNS